MTGEFSKIEKEFGKYGSTALFSTLVLIILLCALLVIAYFIAQSDQGRVLNYFVVLLGALCGWALGIFSSPYSKTEEKRFSSISQAISAFVSGYVLSKFDRFLEASLFTDTKVPQYDTWVRLGLFVAATGLFALLIFSNRAYFRADDDQSDTKGADAQPDSQAGLRE
jgi:F0F1-type ATP synthase membrane subunit a